MKWGKETGEDYTKEYSEFAHTKCYWTYQLVENRMVGNKKQNKIS